MLRISTDKVCYVVVKARELDVKVAPHGLDEGSHSSDDQMVTILEDYAADPTFEELQVFLGGLNDEELEDLIALTWVGRGDFSAEEWEDVLAEIQDVREKHSVEYLIGTPLLADYLEEGLSQFGLSCEDFEMGRM